MPGYRFFLVLALSALILISGCAMNSRNDAIKLRKELERWTGFRSEGIVQANYMGLALRKFYVIQKDKDELRLDVVDGGIMGMSAEPLLSFYKGDYLALKSAMMPQLELLNLTNYFPQAAFRAFSEPAEYLAPYESEILAKRMVTVDSVKVEFTPQLQLGKITDLKSGAEIILTYTGRGILDQVDIKAGNSASVLLLVDTIRHGSQNITPLPPNKGGLDLMKVIGGAIENLMGGKE